MEYKFTNYNHVHPIIRAMLIYSDYDYDPRENVISATSIMKPTQMIVLERSNKDADRLIDIEGMIPSVGGTALHTHLEMALKHISKPENKHLWKKIGIDSPDELHIEMDERKEVEIDDHIVSGKFDVIYKYKKAKWQLSDLKSLSVWAVMIDIEAKKEEWIKQLSIYRYLNQDKDIDDTAMIMCWFTDWSKSDSQIKAKQGYPQSRLDVHEIKLWSLDKTYEYLKKRVADIKLGMGIYQKTGEVETGFICSKDELWQRKGGWAYYTKKTNKKASKIYDTENEARIALSKAKDPTAFIEERKARATRCSYCSVTQFCPQYAEMLLEGIV